MEDNISLDLILLEFKSYEVTIDNINSFKKWKDKINHDLQRSLANNLSLANPLIIPNMIPKYDWPENSLQ